MAAPTQTNNNNKINNDNEKVVVKKSVDTNPLYQSTFMPIFQKAETTIKRLIVYYFWHFKSEFELRKKINAIIEDVAKKIPQTLNDRNEYIAGLLRKSDIMIKKYYRKRILLFLGIKLILDDKYRNITPQQLYKHLQSGKTLIFKEGVDIADQTKALNYQFQIQHFITDVSNEPMTTASQNKKPISLWQKAEMDVRHEKQMMMLDNMIKSGIQYAWLSTHAGCSKRCEKWQGKLVSLTEHATMSNFRVKKLDGIQVYSLLDIMAQVDQYGYHNNIISGFNCRHKLFAYTKGSKAPDTYDQKAIEKERKIERIIRELERAIRLNLTKARMYNEIGDKKNANLYLNRANKLIAKYKQFCDKHGYYWQEYRITI